MKKMLLLLVCLTTFAWLHADEVTFDFMTNAYGVVNTDGSGTPGANNAPYFANPTTATSSPVSIIFAKTSGNGWRFYGDGVRFYKGNASLTISANGATITAIKLAGATASSAFSSYTLNGGTSNKVASADLNIECNTTEAVLAFSKTTSGGKAAFKTITVTYTPAGSPTQVSTPSITPTSGAVETGTKVKISCSDTEAEIHYTTNGDDPTAESAIYTAETDITVNEAMTVKAIAVKAGLDNSNIATAEYTIKKTTAANIAEFISLIKTNPNEVFSIQTPVTAVYQKNLTANNQNLYVTDGTDWLLVYGNVGKTYNNGDVIAAGIKGTAYDYSGTYELTNPDASTFADVVAGTPVEPAEVTSISADIVNHYVVVKGVTIGTPSSDNATATMADGTEIALYNKFKLNNFEAGSNLTVKGFVNVRNNTTIQLLPIEITNAAGEEIVAQPTFSPVAGNVIEGTAVTIACATEGATIYYTTDGTDPSASSTSTEYTAPIAIDKAMTIKAIAVKEGMRDSGIAEAAYTLIVATPTFDHESGEVEKGTPVTITCATPGATLMYQVNGGDIQVGESPVTVVINEATTIEVVASKDGYVDSEAKATYSIKGEVPVNPTAMFDFAKPGELEPAIEAPAFATTNTNPIEGLRKYIDKVVFYNNYALLKFTSPEGAVYSNRSQLWNVVENEVTVVQARAYKNSKFTITAAESLTIDKIEIVGAPEKANITVDNVTVDGILGTFTVSGNTGTWTRGATNALASTTERESVVFNVISSTIRIKSVTVTTTGKPTGVEDVTLDENAPVEYYNLQGVRVENPENGIYIRRQGSKVSKVLVR